MKMRAIVAWNLRRIRVAQGLSQEKLAVDAGIDRTYIGRLERGLQNPTIDILTRLAKALGVPVAELLTAPHPGEPRPAPLPGGRPVRTAKQRPRRHK